MSYQLLLVEDDGKIQEVKREIYALLKRAKGMVPQDVLQVGIHPKNGSVRGAYTFS